MSEEEDTYYAQVMIMNLKKDVFQVQDLKEADGVEKDVKLGRSSV